MLSLLEPETVTWLLFHPLSIRVSVNYKLKYLFKNFILGVVWGKGVVFTYFIYHLTIAILAKSNYNHSNSLTIPISIPISCFFTYFTDLTIL